MALQIGGTTVIDNSRNLVNTTVASATLGSGTASSSTFLRGDRTWQSIVIPIASTAEAQTGTNNTKFITPLRLRQGFNASGSAPVYACRAWVNFSGSGFGEIRRSGNVESVTYWGTSNYSVNFLINLPDTTYSTFVTAGSTTWGPGDTDVRITSANDQSVSSVHVAQRSGSNATTDVNKISVACFG
jgi:hypothetical protein